MNLYFDPEKFGLTVVGEIDYRDAYEFDIVAVYRDSQGRLAYAEDSGCSCPEPFQGHGVDDLVYCTPAELQAYLEKKARENDWTRDEDQSGTKYDADVLELMKRVVA